MHLSRTVITKFINGLGFFLNLNNNTQLSLKKNTTGKNHRSFQNQLFSKLYVYLTNKLTKNTQTTD